MTTCVVMHWPHIIDLAVYPSGGSHWPKRNRNAPCLRLEKTTAHFSFICKLKVKN